MSNRLPPDYVNTEDVLLYHTAADTIVANQHCHRCAAPIWVHWCSRLCEHRRNDIFLCADCHHSEERSE